MPAGLTSLALLACLASCSARCAAAVAASASSPHPRRLLDLLTDGVRPHRQPRIHCVADEKLTLHVASSLAEFGPKQALLERHPLTLEERRLPPAEAAKWVGGGRRRRACDKDGLSAGLQLVLRQQLFAFQVERLRAVLLDHLERVFDLGLVYHDFYSGALADHGGPLRQRPVLVKRLSEFAIGEEGDPEGYAYPREENDAVGAGPSPTVVLELVGQFYYHAHSREQCRPDPCAPLGPGFVPVQYVARAFPLHMRRAFCNYYHFTTVALPRVVALLPRLLADPSIQVLIPHTNRKGQATPFIAAALEALGLRPPRVRTFPPCELVLVGEALFAGTGPRAVFGTEPGGRRQRAVMADVADRGPTSWVRRAMLAALPQSERAEGLLLLDRRERRRIANLADVLLALSGPPLPGLAAGSPFYCEELSFSEQVALFRGCGAAVAVHGACLTNTLYMPARALVVDLVPVRNFMGAGVVMPLDCGVTWFWTLATNVGLRYRPLMLAAGDFDGDAVEVPTDELVQVLLRHFGRRPAQSAAHRHDA